MHLDINDNTTLKEIQDVFSDFYPYLKLEFYMQPHKLYEASKEKDQISHDKTIAEIKQTHVSGLLEIRPLNKVSDVEKEFLQRFGLSAQVLKKEKTGWVQTTGMDDFTLKELNEFGRSSSDDFILSEPDSEFSDEEQPPLL
jgi:glycerol-3-phosphate O-acyltransferase